MELVKPDIGLLFWMTTCFLLLLFIMKKYAWGPILEALKERERGIQEALDQASEAKQQVSEAAERVSQILADGRTEKETMIKAAQIELVDYKKEQQKKINEQINAELNAAKDEIAQQKRAAIVEMKRGVADLSIKIAEKIIRRELGGQKQHEEIIKNNVEQLDIN